MVGFCVESAPVVNGILKVFISELAGAAVVISFVESKSKFALLIF
jgi:hypothetical protein